ncbi:MAG: TIGR00730 family Rossman fold protein [Bacteroidota bacterium]
MIKSVCVFCGSSVGKKPVYAETAHKLGEVLAEKGMKLVFGGGKVGLMGATAEGCLNKGGQAIGVIPQSLYEKEVAHTGIQELKVVETMHERKKLMYDLSDAFVAMPGGYGTLDEFCEVLTWSQLGYHHKPIAFLNVEGYFDRLIDQFHYSFEEGFITQNHLDMIIVETSIEAMFEKIRAYKYKDSSKWITKDVKP